MNDEETIASMKLEASVEEVCVKCEPSLEGVNIKREPSWDHSGVIDELCENVCVKTEPSCSDACVKDEPSCPEGADSRGVCEAAAAARLYSDHVVKEELVLGPALVQPPVQTQQTEPSGTSKSDQWRCGHCTYVAGDKVMLLYHLTTHSSNGFYKCGQKAKLLHETQHARLKPDTLGQHRKARSIRNYTRDNECIYTGRSINIYKCKQCSFASSQKSNLQVHERIHTGDKLHKCRQCGFTSIDRHGLEVHAKIHSHEKYKCSYCSYASFNKDNLKTHEIMHTKEKCDYCSFSSIDRHTLEAHVRMHNAYILYKCGECSFASADKHNLRTHEIMHVSMYKYEKRIENFYKRTSNIPAVGGAGRLIDHDHSYERREPSPGPCTVLDS